MVDFSASVKLGKVPLIGGRITDGARVGLKAAGLYVKGVASTYPKVRRLKVDTKLWTLKQRKYFFWALRKGVIEVPYRRGGKRSQRLGARWAVDESRLDAGQVTVGNNASYAPVVYDRKNQSWYHKGNWLNTQQIAKKAGPQARRIVRAGVANKLQGR